MVQTRRRRNYEPEDYSDDLFEDAFIVSGKETFFIDDQKIVVEDAEHIIKHGQEFVIIGDQNYPVDRSDEESYADNEERADDQHHEQPAAPSAGFGTAGIIIFAVIVGVIIFLFAGPVYNGFAGVMSEPDNENIISPSNRSAIDPTPEAMQVQSTESETALKIKNAMDYTNPTTRDFALTLIPNSHEGTYNIAQICDLWEAVYKKWTYVNDPRGPDYFSPASRTIQLGLKGDCDDFAITVGSIVQSIGGSSRIVIAYNAKSGHAYPEVYIGTGKVALDKVGTYISKRYHTTGIAYHTRTIDGVTQYWLNLDWQSQYPGGKFFQDSGELTIYYPNGYWYRSG